MKPKYINILVVLFEVLLFIWTYTWIPAHLGICFIEPLHTTEDSSNAGTSDSSDQSKQVLHYGQSAVVVESLNKQVSYFLYWQCMLGRILDFV